VCVYGLISRLRKGLKWEGRLLGAGLLFAFLVLYLMRE
jgi:hypothetical protein